MLHEMLHELLTSRDPRRVRPSSRNPPLMRRLRAPDATLRRFGSPRRFGVGARPAQGYDYGSRPARSRSGQLVRSSPAICAAVDSLRAGSDRDSAIGRNVGVKSPVVLLPYRRRQSLPEVLAKVMGAHEMPQSELIVLAHSADHARIAAGAPGSGSDSTSRLVILAGALHAIGDPHRSGAERVAAMRSVERTIRELGIPEVVDLDHPDYLDPCGLSERTFLEACLRVGVHCPGRSR